MTDAPPPASAPPASARKRRAPFQHDFGFDVDTRRLLRLLEAILFAAAEPLSEKAIAARMPAGADLKTLLPRLREDYEGRGVELRQAGGAWAFRTAPDLAPALVVAQTESRRLSRAAMETLAIIAYHQPVTRAEIEDIRGVALSKGTLDLLLEAGWVRPRGRRQTPGRPLTWGTTDGFLDHFGLESLRDLPGVEELKAAGLLDSRPALAAYGARARDDGTMVDTEEPPPPTVATSGSEGEDEDGEGQPPLL